jgi:hypothetical protein
MRPGVELDFHALLNKNQDVHVKLRRN